MNHAPNRDSLAFEVVVEVVIGNPLHHRLSLYLSCGSLADAVASITQPLTQRCVVFSRQRKEAVG